MPHAFPFGLNIDWSSAKEHDVPNPYLRNWLLHTGSLTERIESMCRHFHVDVLGQGEAPLHDNETDKLPLDASHYHVREVVLYADQRPWVFARSVIPKVLTQGEWETLGDSPLGKRLFNDPRFVRGDFELAECNAGALSALYSDQDAPSQHTLYGRRSAFHFAGQDIIVAEVFLPDSPVYQGGC